MASDFVNPSSEIRLARVPFGIDRKNVFCFSGKNKQYLVDVFTENFVTQTYTNINIIKNTKSTLDIRGNLDLYDTFNYVLFRNPDTDNKWWFAFVLDVEYIANLTTRLHISIDEWHTFIYDTVFYESFIERSHISKNLDTIGFNTEPEPVSRIDVYESQDFAINVGDWTPTWVLESVSLPKEDEPGDWDWKTDIEYGGYGRYGTRYGTYGILVDLAADNTAGIWSIQDIIEVYANAELTNDHREDLIGLTARPKWIIDLLPSRDINTNPAGGMYRYYALLRNRLITKTVDVKNNMDFVKTASNYTPRNKKLLTSQYCNFKIINYKGLEITLKPELAFDKNTFRIAFSGRPMNGNIAIDLYDYPIAKLSHLTIPYNYTEPIAFNINDSLNYKINAISSGVGTVATTATQIGAGVGTPTPFMLGDIDNDYIAKMNAKSQIGHDFGVARSGISGAASSVGPITNAANNFASLGEANIATTGGYNGDFATIDPYYNIVRMFQTSPIYNECVHIDKFFDLYGYAQNTIGSIWANMHTRSNWNFVKTNNANIKVNAPAIYEQAIKNMLDKGVTVWHTVEDYGNYSVANN